MIPSAVNFRKGHMVFWLMAGTTIFFLFTQTRSGSNELSSKVIEENEVMEEEGMKTVSFKMEHCNCVRKLKVNLTAEELGAVPYNETTCGRDAYRRGAGQKIVGFSFYGDVNSSVSIEKGYFDGIVGNLRLMPKFYPGWVMRLYFDLDRTDPVHTALCNLACSDNNIDICDAANLPGTPMKDATKVFAMNWRFFPTLDPQVDVYVCRDLDSRFSSREVAAVDEWLSMDHPIHSMRDHPNHNTALLGAAWGADLRKRNSRERWKKSWTKIFEDPLTFAPRSAKGPDQTILTRHVWLNWARRMSVQHDSYLCKEYRGSIGFPTQREMVPNNFVAAVYKDKAMLDKRCPAPCRRYIEWEHC